MTAAAGLWNACILLELVTESDFPNEDVASLRGRLIRNVLSNMAAGGEDASFGMGNDVAEAFGQMIANDFASSHLWVYDGADFHRPVFGISSPLARRMLLRRVRCRACGHGSRR